MLLTDHNNKGSHGPNPLWLLSLTPPHPPPISSAHIGSDLPTQTFPCLSLLACAHYPYHLPFLFSSQIIRLAPPSLSRPCQDFFFLPLPLSLLTVYLLFPAEGIWVFWGPSSPPGQQNLSHFLKRGVESLNDTC